MSYQVKQETVTVAGTGYIIRSLLDLQQYADPLGDADRAGISSASWSMFGQVWPSARILALAMDSFDLVGKRVLEIGAGLALPSLVVHRRAGNMTVSDWHPLSQSFLNANILLNGMLPIKYQTGSWAESNPALGQFDLIIGSDILYERQQPSQLAAFIDLHAAKSAQVIIVDPDRGNRVGFCREMSCLGYSFSSQRADLFVDASPYKGRFLNFVKQ